MSREIKFRAWDNEKKFMFNIGKINFERTYVTRKGGYDLIYYFTQLELMQYTGLKDCKGNEIYEGDIVEERNISDGEHTRRVVFNRGCFWTEGNDGNGNLLYIPLRIKVIGNIYENKELIKETK